jgi:D-glycero-D-manno-heptose 1,7-bisphosphate phosphatase
MSKALFLDRDGTLIVDKNYLADPAGVDLLPGTSEALRRARSLGYKLFLFTNQSGIGRGCHSLEDTQRVNVRMEELIGLGSPLFEAVCIAPEAPDQPAVYRKPSPRFILEMRARYALDPAHCWMVGDSAADFGAGYAAKINVAAVRTGKVDPATFPDVATHQVPVFANLAAFVSKKLDS